MDVFFIVLMSLYFGIGSYEFYLAWLQGNDKFECFIRSIVWPVEVYYVFKDVIWKYRNWPK